MEGSEGTGVKISRQKAKQLIIDNGGARLSQLWWHYVDGWREVAVNPDISGWREWVKIQSNGIQFTGGSWLRFDGAECHYDQGELELRYGNTMLVYELEDKR